MALLNKMQRNEVARQVDCPFQVARKRFPVLGFLCIHLIDRFHRTRLDTIIYSNKKGVLTYERAAKTEEGNGV